MIRPDGECRLAVGRQRNGRVGAQFEYVLGQAASGQRFPLVDRSVDTARHQSDVVGRPHDAAHLAVVTFQVGNVLEGSRRVDLNNVAVDCGEVVAAIAERALQDEREKT